MIKLVNPLCARYKITFTNDEGCTEHIIKEFWASTKTVNIECKDNWVIHCHDVTISHYANALIYANKEFQQYTIEELKE